MQKYIYSMNEWWFVVTKMCRTIYARTHGWMNDGWVICMHLGISMLLKFNNNILIVIICLKWWNISKWIWLSSYHYETDGLYNLFAPKLSDNLQSSLQLSIRKQALCQLQLIVGTIKNRGLWKKYFMTSTLFSLLEHMDINMLWMGLQYG